ncbi:NPC1 [Mytilus edulis]|uniref:NPC1 n=1 Tax=Mytilus edulis TaxID=6550 RepID=A0A8S3RPX1_MYTED|nr:NPC1 [Mytilus edulis]
MRGECGNDKLSCAYDGPPSPLINPEYVGILKQYCLFMVPGDQPSTCCIFGFVKEDFTRCPICFDNFISMFCLLVCSSYQSTLASANVTIDSSTKQIEVTSVDYYVSRDYVDGMFNSCANVRTPYSNEKAINRMCVEGTSACTPKNFLKFVGSKSNRLVTYDVSFKETDKPFVRVGNKTFVPMNYTTTPCSDRCQCMYCNTTGCSSPPTTTTLAKWKIF